ncbi:MAG: hypothetical protein LQ346_008961, partial [Caloplaca aetnensis]
TFTNAPYTTYAYNDLTDHHCYMRILRELLRHRTTVPARYPSVTWVQALQHLALKAEVWVEELKERHEEFRRVYIGR